MNLELEVSADLIRGVKQLAKLHYGDSDFAAVSKVVETALHMRLEWLDLVEKAGSEVEEPVARWEHVPTRTGGQPEEEVAGWLFGGRQ